jgi:prolyl oligopeptidase
MGAVLTQHPDLAAAVVAMVPVLDMLRVELHPNGAFNVTEFGTVQDPELFRAMHAYSPYHNVVDGTPYPAVLLTAGEFDPRVDAYHAKKMAARLQAATSSGQPVLLRIESGGHGLGSSLDQRVSELADVYAFLLDRLDAGQSIT